VRKDGETPLFDGLGSERTVTNTSGAVQGTLTMTAFGQAVASTGSSTDPYEFAATSGYRSDGDAGLTLVGARYYDAQVGIFISRDTDLDEEPYVYCDGDPVNTTDPDGHKPERVRGVDYPFPELTSTEVTLSGGVSVGGSVAGAHAGGEQKITINTVIFWKYRVPLHDKRILARHPLSTFIKYLDSVENTGTGTP
jgi:RHS repeat-associated protein